jgi:HPt (histidine-containing phosphotransfer) domain-containing protein
MNTASLHDIKKELHTLDAEALADLCMRLAKYKKENKELLSYLLFEAHNEQAYIASVKEHVDELYTTLPSRTNLYLVKKTLRKILRVVNKQIKYSGVKETEVDLRIYFCTKIKEARIPLTTGTVLYNLYQQQLKKINAALDKMPEDLQADYQRDVEKL